MIAVSPGGPDLGGWAMPLTAGYAVGSAITNGFLWYQTVQTPYGSPPALLTACTDGGCIGYFTGQNAFLGVRFQASDGTHYGWMRLELPFVGVNGGYIREWAYDTGVDAPILDGAIPEPSTISLLIHGGILLTGC